MMGHKVVFTCNLHLTQDILVQGTLVNRSQTELAGLCMCTIDGKCVFVNVGSPLFLTSQLHYDLEWAFSLSAHRIGSNPGTLNSAFFSSCLILFKKKKKVLSFPSSTVMQIALPRYLQTAPHKLHICIGQRCKHHNRCSLLAAAW